MGLLRLAKNVMDRKGTLESILSCRSVTTQSFDAWKMGMPLMGIQLC